MVYYVITFFTHGVFDQSNIEYALETIMIDSLGIVYMMLRLKAQQHSYCWLVTWRR